MSHREKIEPNTDPLTASGGSVLSFDYSGQFFEESIDEFITLYRAHFGVTLDREQARLKGSQLCKLIQMVDYEPID